MADGVTYVDGDAEIIAPNETLLRFGFSARGVVYALIDGSIEKANEINPYLRTVNVTADDSANLTEQFSKLAQPLLHAIQALGGPDEFKITEISRLFRSMQTEYTKLRYAPPK